MKQMVCLLQRRRQVLRQVRRGVVVVVPLGTVPAEVLLLLMEARIVIWMAKVPLIE